MLFRYVLKAGWVVNENVLIFLEFSSWPPGMITPSLSSSHLGSISVGSPTFMQMLWRTQHAIIVTDAVEMCSSIGLRMVHPPTFQNTTSFLNDYSGFTESLVIMNLFLCYSSHLLERFHKPNGQRVCGSPTSKGPTSTGPICFIGPFKQSPWLTFQCRRLIRRMQASWMLPG